MLHDLTPDMRFLTFFSFIIAATFAYVSVADLLKGRQSTSGRRAPRPTDIGTHEAWCQFLLLSILCGVGYLEGWSLQDMGVSEDRSHIVAFLAGVTCYPAFAAAYHWIVARLGVHGQMANAVFDTIRLRWPRDRNEKRLLVWSTCVLNPITEEVLFRGILIHEFGRCISSTSIAIGIGLLLSLLSHAYQGLSALPGQLMFHGLAVVLLLSPFGLLACIGFHFAGNLYPTLMTRRTMNECVARRRSRIQRANQDGQPHIAADIGVSTSSPVK